MVTGIKDGRILLLESKTGVDDWITDHAGNPDSIDLDNFTEGIDFCQFNFPMKMMKRGKTGAKVTVTSSGKSYDARKAARFYNAIVTGKTEGRAPAYLIENFLMSDRHTSGASATFERYYLVIQYGTTDQEPFRDSFDNIQKYCKGICTDWEIVWSEPNHVNMDVRINWWSVW